ncbi:MAG: GAF domain-containing sensor histidine kinase [Acidimicrobiales bacterium]
MSPVGGGPVGGGPGAGGEAMRWAALLRRVIEVSSEDDVDRTVQVAAELIVAAASADVCFVHLVDTERGLVVLKGATPPFDEMRDRVKLKLGEGIAGWVALHGEPAVVPDKWSDPRYRYIPALHGEDYQALVSVPMVSKPRRDRHGTRQVIGVLNLHWRQPRSLGEEEVTFVTDVADLLAGTIENVVMKQNLSQRESALASFAGGLVEAQEAERRRLAGELHDGVTQRLLSLSYHLDAAAASATAGGATAGDDLAAQIGRARDLASEALVEIRSSIAALRPGVLEDLGLAAALEGLATSLARSGPPSPAGASPAGPNPPGAFGPVEVRLQDVELSRHVETAVYRVAQEALRNAARHSGAATASIELRREGGSVVLEVRDDGEGFANEEAGGDRYGIQGMRERAQLVGGRLEILSRPGHGSTVTLRVPAGRPSSAQAASRASE